MNAELEGLRTASLVKAPWWTFSHASPVFCFPSSRIQEFEDSLYFPQKPAVYQIFNTDIVI